VNAILEGMTWLGLEYDEGPFFQTRRFPRYREVMEQMLRDGRAYYCYCSKERLEQLRNEQMARKEKPRYDGRCRAGVPNPPAGVKPVVRFKNPQGGSIVVEDLIRGRVVFQNAELDDLIIARADGTPTVRAYRSGMAPSASCSIATRATCRKRYSITWSGSVGRTAIRKSFRSTK